MQIHKQPLQKDEDYQELVSTKKTIDSYFEKGNFMEDLVTRMLDVLYKKTAHKEVKQAAIEESDEYEDDNVLETKNTEMNYELALAVTVEHTLVDSVELIPRYSSLLMKPAQEDILELEEDGLDDDADPVKMALDQEFQMKLKKEKKNFNKQKPSGQLDYEKVLKKEMSIYETEGVRGEHL
ncbi:hypothetical protein HHI36_014508 [Cryptolaemus montrouzieri]|uniref:Uncharacterized protein n=1 Tax=Cryptolaemus montrouzieri TaxID=559131 RepID=A0ABD2N3G2_9CUCU